MLRDVRTEQRLSGLEAALERLADAQARTDESIRALAAAQARTDESVRALAAAQARTEARVDGLEQAVKQLARQVGGLSDTVGGDIEDIAYIVLHDVLAREFGWQVGVLERTWVTWNSRSEEVDVFGRANDPARPGYPIWIVGEAKHNLTAGEVDRFVRQVGRARQRLDGEIFPVCFCYRARPEVQQKVHAAGLRLVFSYGKLI